MPKYGMFSKIIVSCDWLLENRKLEQLIILDASVSKDSNAVKSYIPNSRYFDMKSKFSDNKAPFPNTIPSQAQFQKEAQALGIHKDSIIVVYDDKGMYWSPRVRWLFKTFGFDHVAVLDGGLPEWKRLNFETVNQLDSRAYDIGNFEATYQPDMMCYLDDIIELSKHDTALILDARSSERFNCLVKEPREGLRSGIIPNSQNLPYMNLLDGHCFKSNDLLKRIFRAFEIGDKSVTFTCGSGITACIVALAAEISDYKKLSVYDGSWTEYGTLIPE